MPYKPARPCRHIGCPRLAIPGMGYCKEHATEAEEAARQRYRDDIQKRGTSTERGYDARWRDARKLFLDKNPLCVQCMQKGELTPATVVDHIIPHRGDQRLFWDENNWQPLCKSCHDKKTGSGL